MQQIAVIGAGSWGTAMAVQLSQTAQVSLWCRRAELVAEIIETGENTVYTGSLSIPPSIRITNDLREASHEATVVIVAVPSQYVRATLRNLAHSAGDNVLVVSLTKGLEQRTQLRVSEIVNQELPGRPCVVFTGPNLVNEIILAMPAAAVAVSRDTDAAVAVQRLFSSEQLRVYTHSDVVGAEVAGALKNVVAIGVGMVDGLGYGINAKAALITRGLAEISRLGVALGGMPSTFLGLAGVGDLVATCTSPFSRNRTFGERLASGAPATEIEADSATVAEGVHTSSAAVALATSVGIEMPIANVVARVIAGEVTAAEGALALMQRQAGIEQ